MTPLTHHQIIEIVAPYTRRGRRVDLAASDRAAQRLLFQPVALESGLRETLSLQCEPDDRCTLTRRVVHPSGLQATLAAAGAQDGSLLAEIEAFDPAQQFRAGAGWLLALSYERVVAREGAKPGWVLRRGVVQLAAVTLTMDVLALRGAAADFVLEPTADALDLPEDLLAVLGWDWSRLMPTGGGWKSRLRLRGSLHRRTRQAEAALERAAQHLGQVLAETPGRFHARFAAARWGVFFRRLIPSLTVLLLIAGALLLPHLTDGPRPGLYMALHYVPIAVLALAFSLQEMARFEIPPWPRRSRAADWRRGRSVGGVRSLETGST